MPRLLLNAGLVMALTCVGLGPAGPPLAQSARNPVPVQAAQNPLPPPAQPSPAQPSAPGPVAVVIDPGHGGTDAGARGSSGILEKDVALGLAVQLRAAQFIVYETP